MRLMILSIRLAIVNSPVLRRDQQILNVRLEDSAPLTKLDARVSKGKPDTTLRTTTGDTEIVAFIQLFPVLDIEEFVYFIGKMDSAFLEWHLENKKRKEGK